MIQRYAVDGPAVVVPARIALLLECHYRMDRLRMDVRGRDPELDEVLNAWHAVAMQWSPETGSENGSVTGTEVAGASEPVAPSEAVEQISASEVANQFGCTTRAVTKAAAERRLRGQFVAGRWLFHPDDVAVWAATRAA